MDMDDPVTSCHKHCSVPSCKSYSNPERSSNPAFKHWICQGYNLRDMRLHAVVDFACVKRACLFPGFKRCISEVIF